MSSSRCISWITRTNQLIARETPIAMSTQTQTQTTHHVCPQNALSNSASGGYYPGQDCVRLGHHVTHTEINDLVSQLHSLRAHKMLRPVTSTQIDTMKAQLAPAIASPKLLGAPQARRASSTCHSRPKVPQSADIYIPQLRASSLRRTSSMEPRRAERMRSHDLPLHFRQAGRHRRHYIAHIPLQQKDIPSTVLLGGL